MSKVTCDMAISADGFTAGPNQRLDAPLGEGGDRLHRWQFEEREANAEVIERIVAAGLIDELRLHIAPVVLGAGERLFTDVGDLSLEQTAVANSALATHVTYRIVR